MPRGKHLGSLGVMLLVCAVAIGGHACSLVTGSGQLEFTRDDESSLGGAEPGSGGQPGAGGMVEDGSGGAGSGGEGGDGAGGTVDGAGGSQAGTGVIYDFETSLQGWRNDMVEFGWGVSPEPSLMGGALHGELYCDDPPCEVTYAVPLDPTISAQDLVLLMLYTFDSPTPSAFQCNLGFDCNSVWEWSDDFMCDSSTAGQDAWDALIATQSDCFLASFGIRIKGSSVETAVFDLDYLSLTPP